MTGSDLPPSKPSAALKFRGAPFAEVWFEPEGDPLTLTFRIHRTSFDIPGMAQRLTVENLLKAVGRTMAEVESWRREGTSHKSTHGPDSESGDPLPSPPEDVPHLNVFVTLKRPHAVASRGSDEEGIPEEKWQEIEARWNAILGLEASVDTLRISMETLRGELEGSSRRMMSPEEKVNALNADVAQWNKAKSRVLHALPKAREYIHRSTWAAGTPERKKLEEIIKNHVRPRIPFPGMDELVEQLENLLKDRQILSAHGVSVHQECKSIAADVQGALRTLQGNAAANATKKRAANIARGKSF